MQKNFDLKLSLSLEEKVACMVSLALQQSLVQCRHVERNTPPLTGRNLQQNKAQCKHPSATSDWGFEKMENKDNRKTEVLQQKQSWENWDYITVLVFFIY